MVCVCARACQQHQHRCINNPHTNNATNTYITGDAQLPRLNRDTQEDLVNAELPPLPPLSASAQQASGGHFGRGAHHTLEIIDAEDESYEPVNTGGGMYEEIEQVGIIC